MKDLPLKSVQPSFDRNLLPASGKPVVSSELEKVAEIAKNADASIVSLPRMKAKSAQTDDAGAVLESFLSDVHKEKDVVAAHSGLDASRVFDLLSDEE